MDAPPPQHQTLENDYSATATLVHFPHPLPLLRVPLPASPRDDPSKGPHVLAFKDPQHWLNTYNHCTSTLTTQCEHGARIGCSVAVSNLCRPPWWQRLIGWKIPDLKDREKCEEDEMEKCLAAAKARCGDFAKGKCATSFRDARIGVGKRGLRGEDAGKLIWLASVPEKSRWVDLIGFEELGMRVLGGCEFRVTNYRATEMFGSEENVDRILSGVGGRYDLKA